MLRVHSVTDVTRCMVLLRVAFFNRISDELPGVAMIEHLTKCGILCSPVRYAKCTNADLLCMACLYALTYLLLMCPACRGCFYNHAGMGSKDKGMVRNPKPWYLHYSVSSRRQRI